MNTELFDEDDENDEDSQPDVRGTGQTRLRDAADAYLADFEGSTYEKNKAALKTLLDFGEERGVFFVEQLSRAILSAHKKWLKSNVSVHTSKPRSAVTRRCYTVVVKSFLRDLLTHYHLARDVYYSYKLSRNVKSSVYVATDAQCLLVYDVIGWFWDEAKNPGVKYFRPSLRRFHASRMRVVIAIALSCALRISETCNIQIPDYNVETQEITIRETKTNDERVVPVTAALEEDIKAWLKVRPKKSTCSFLIVNESGEKMSVNALAAQYRRYLNWARAQGIELPNITMHSHRHKSISSMVTKNPRHAQILAGHGSITTTITKYDHQVAEEVRVTHAERDVWTRLKAQSKPPAKPRGRKVA